MPPEPWPLFGEAEPPTGRQFADRVDGDLGVAIDLRLADDGDGRRRLIAGDVDARARDDGLLHGRRIGGALLPARPARPLRWGRGEGADGSHDDVAKSVDLVMKIPFVFSQ